MDYSEYEYCGSQHWDPAFANILLQVVADLTGVESICELGCGNGAMARLLVEEGYDVVGVDASGSGIQIAKTASKGAVFYHDRIDHGLASRLGRASSFDLVLSSEVIEHLYRPADFLEAALSLIRPGGWRGLTTP